MNFEKQRGFLRALEQLPDFKEYVRVCMTHEAVRKNDLSSLLISPIQHQCRYKLLLEVWCVYVYVYVCLFVCMQDFW